jgi:hypothetical protein
VIDLKLGAPASEAALELAKAAPPEEPHAPDDVGGRVELGHGWTPSVPTRQSGAFDQMLAAQKQPSGPGAV